MVDLRMIDTFNVHDTCTSTNVLSFIARCSIQFMDRVT